MMSEMRQNATETGSSFSKSYSVLQFSFDMKHELSPSVYLMHNFSFVAFVASCGKFEGDAIPPVSKMTKMQRQFWIYRIL